MQKHQRNRHMIGKLTKFCINLRSNYKFKSKITKLQSKIEKREEKEKKCSAKIALESFDRKPDMESLQSSPIPLSL